MAGRSDRGRYPARVDYAVCPGDDTQLQVVAGRHDPVQPPLLMCPACGGRFQLAPAGVVEVPATTEGDPAT